jgi:hypothetical protein
MLVIYGSSTEYKGQETNGNARMRQRMRSKAGIVIIPDSNRVALILCFGVDRGPKSCRGRMWCQLRELLA